MLTFRDKVQRKSGRPYALLLADIIVIADEFLEVTNDYFMERPVKHRNTSHQNRQGTLWSLNSNLFRMLSEVDSSAKFVAIGKRATQYLSCTRRDLADFSLPTNPAFPTPKRW